MTSQTNENETAVSALYHNLLDAWNNHSAADYAALFADDAHVVGFDGSLMNSRQEIESSLSAIFADHVTAAYVSKIRGIDFLAPEVAVLRAVVGMIPPGKSDINPERNAVQSLVAAKHGGDWRIVLFQNTPAQFHDRPELADALTAELRALL